MPQKLRATQSDVAKYAGVSQAMVSYVLNNNNSLKIPEETRQRILEAMNELEYVPNALARGLRSGQTKTIGLVVPDNSNPFFAEIARVIENLGFENGYSVILCNSDYDVEKENTYVDVLLAKQVDGMIFISSGGKRDAIQKLRDSHTPYVTVDHDIVGYQTDAIQIDYQMGGYLAARYLLELGHQRVACITGPNEFSSSSERVDGYLQALAEAGHTVDRSLIVSGDFRIRGGELAMNILLDLETPPTAVFACNDLMAVGAVQAARRRCIEVPEGLSVVGFDDIPLAEVLYPSLTTIRLPIAEIAANTMGTFLKQVQGKAGSEDSNGSNPLILQPKLIVRDSTCKKSS